MRDFVANGSGEVYVVTGPADPRVFVYGAPTIVPTVTVKDATEVTTTSATLQGTVNPEGLELTECFFEWGTGTSYGNAAPCDPEASLIPADSEPHEVQAEISGLTPNGEVYHYRLAARNANGIERSADHTLSTETTAKTEAATEITRFSATLQRHRAPRRRTARRMLLRMGPGLQRLELRKQRRMRPRSSGDPAGRHRRSGQRRNHRPARRDRIPLPPGGQEPRRQTGSQRGNLHHRRPAVDRRAALLGSHPERADPGSRNQPQRPAEPPTSSNGARLPATGTSPRSRPKRSATAPKRSASPPRSPASPKPPPTTTA